MDLGKFENKLEMLEFQLASLIERLEALEKKLKEREGVAENLALAFADRFVEKSNELPKV